MADVTFTAWLGNAALTGNPISYPSAHTTGGFAPATTLDAAEFNGAFRMMSVVAAAIMNGITAQTPNSSVADVDNAIKAKIENIPVKMAKAAEALKTAQTLQVALGSTAGQSFDGSADATSIGVSGILPPAHGGTGTNNLLQVHVGYADTSEKIEISGTAYTLSLSNTTLTLTEV